MTVAELRERLETLPQNATIRVEIEHDTGFAVLTTDVGLLHEVMHQPRTYKGDAEVYQ